MESAWTCAEWADLLSREASQGLETCVVDLVAEPFAAIEDPLRPAAGSATVSVDTPHEILVNKLCSLLGRAELRDLVDVKALLDAGESLESALADVPKKDAGSALTLPWVLKGLAPEPVARALGWGAEETDEIAHFHRTLIERILAAAAPE